jgi:hypothetical protein
MNEQRENPEERDRKYAQEIGKRSRWPIGDTNEGTGTLEPSGDVGPATGAGGLSQQERGGLDALAEERSSADLESGSPVERGPLDRAEERVDTSAAGSLNSAAVQAAGLVGHSEDELPGTDDLGAAGGKDLGAGLGRTRGKARQNPRGQITGVGGTRGSGAGTGHLDDKSG